MICKTTCAVALVFLAGTIYTSYAKSYGTIKPFLATLNDFQQQKYDEIAKERRDLSLKGYGLGFALSLFFIIFNYVSKSSSKSSYKISYKGMICLAVSTTLVVQYLYYILSPKSDWMVNYLMTSEQKHAWLKVYRTMQFNWHAGIALGLITIALFATAFRCD
tara:strand:+ start:373 stop:858 length:486 start_codon:yes stop_codon:yes gene_type:complete